MALQNISQKWTMPIRDWKDAVDEFGLILYKPVQIKEMDGLLTQALREISEPVKVLGSRS
ncbi:hypothetical protein HJG40_09115 [Acidithiobacillus sp. ATCC 19703]|uniref:Transposase n=1 Tax=Acidithiobacillus concretivorus TaxID=3063952 RepID=A0ABS5ZQJ9_9PROT|nr:hypothetical protein [Acidithiobacillus concretivorus]